MLKGIMIVLMIVGIVGCSNTGSTPSPQRSSVSEASGAEPMYRFQIHFDVGSSKIQQKYMPQIKEFAAYLKRNPLLQVEIQGHTDSDGDSHANRLLSQQRAEAVKAKLVSFGVDEKRITAKGYGASKPLVANTTRENKFANRRVEAHIINKVMKPQVYVNPGYIEGVVVDALSGAPLGSVSIKVYQDGKLVNFFTTDVSGKYKIKLEAGKYLLKFERLNYLLADIYAEVLPHDTVSMMALKQISIAYAGNGVLGGIVKNAFNGKGVANLTLYVRKGWNNQEGKTIKVLKTDAKGNYHLKLPLGYYTIEAVKDGYLRTYFNVIAVGGHRLVTQNSTITPQINKGEVRIVLSWGAYPKDLDAHLHTPNRYHIFWKAKGSRNTMPFADLDIDDTVSYGPETITIYKSQDGIYRYSVNNYSRSPDIKGSNARVQVYGSGGLIREFHVPSRGKGLIWNVFEYNGATGEIKTINTLSNRY